MGFLVSPSGLIALSAVTGLLLAGPRGLAFGLIVGLGVSIVLGLVVRAVSGGSIPRHVRRALIVNLIAHDSETVKAAFPGLTGNALFRALENEVEEVIRAAIKLSPTHQAIFAENIIRLALRNRLMDEHDPNRRAMLLALGERLLQDWYPHTSIG